MTDQLTKRADDYAQWYNDLVLKADLAEHSDVRGCMVVEPSHQALFTGRRCKRALDDMFKATGHTNAYFPLFIPKRATWPRKPATWKISRRNARWSRITGSKSHSGARGHR